jgi:RNA polymerase sigma factor (sigma-70 family)
MDENTLNSRLSRISTIWTLLGEPPHSALEEKADAQSALVQRYQRAVYRYLLGALRDADAADDVFQEFALRVVQGAFRRACPERGRFRDYLRTTLIHLVTDYQNQRRKRPVFLDKDLAEPAAPPDEPLLSDEQFLSSWREEILARAWELLDEGQREGGPPFHTALRFRAANPAASSADMAAHLNRGLAPENAFTEAATRKILQRARMRFADLLLDEVAGTLEHPSLDDLEQELILLDLLPYCRSAIARRRGERGDGGE